MIDTLFVTRTGCGLLWLGVRSWENTAAGMKWLSRNSALVRQSLHVPRIIFSSRQLQPSFYAESAHAMSRGLNRFSVNDRALRNAVVDTAYAKQGPFAPLRRGKSPYYGRGALSGASEMATAQVRVKVERGILARNYFWGCCLLCNATIGGQPGPCPNSERMAGCFIYGAHRCGAGFASLLSINLICQMCSR
jgi:hypothetical protein